MRFFLYALLISVGGIGVIGLMSAIFALPWHMYYAKRGQRQFPGSGLSYREGLAFRGFMTFALPLAGFLITSAIGQSVTARMDSAQTVVKIDSTFAAGVYVRVARDELPEASRKMLGKNDVIFVRAASDRNGDRAIIKAYEREDELNQLFPIGSKLELLEVRWRYRYPAQAFRFMGALTDRTDVVKAPDGNRLVIKGFAWWSTIKS